MLRIFISGHMDGNRVAFEVEAARLGRMGYIAVNPFDFDYPSNDRADCMRVSIGELRKCDGISMLAEWEDWPGPVDEHRAAWRLGLMIMLPYATKQQAEDELAACLLRIALAVEQGELLVKRL